jgi:hypothetical protein
MNTSANIPSPQGVGSNFTGTGAFADNTKYLVLELPATDASPYSNATRNLVRRANTPNPCGASSEVNTTFTVQVIYFVSNSVLYRRTYVPDFIASDLCSTPWQQNSCTAAYITAASRCRVADETIAENVMHLSIEYFQSPEQTTATTDAVDAYGKSGHGPMRSSSSVYWKNGLSGCSEDRAIVELLTLDYLGFCHQQGIVGLGDSYEKRYSPTVSSSRTYHYVDCGSDKFIFCAKPHVDSWHTF